MTVGMTAKSTLRRLRCLGVSVFAAVLAGATTLAISGAGSASAQVLAQDPGGEVVEVFLYGGQSNMVGLIRHSEEELLAALKQVVGEDTDQHATVLLGYSVGTTSIYSHWAADGTADSTNDGPVYQDFQDAVDEGLADLADEYPDAEIRITALLFNQGERDAITGVGASYGENLQRFIDDVRLTYEQPDLVFLPSRIRESSYYAGRAASLRGVRDGVRAVGQNDPYTVAVDLDEIAGFGGLHYSVAGYDEMASLYGQAYATYAQDTYGEVECGVGLIDTFECVYARAADISCANEDASLTAEFATNRSESSELTMSVNGQNESLGTISNGNAIPVSRGPLRDGDWQFVWAVDGMPIKQWVGSLDCDVERLGDADCNRLVDRADVLALLDSELGRQGSEPCEQDGSNPEPLHQVQCDLDGDGACGLGDAQLIARCLAELGQGAHSVDACS